MSINNTTLLGLAQPVTGQESGVWGDDVNNGFTSIVDIAIAGTNNITQDSDITLSTLNGSNSTSFATTGSNSTTAQYYILNCTGARTAARNIIAPATSRAFLVYNKTSGGYAITIKKSGGTGVTIANGEVAIVFYDSITASDFVKTTSNLTNVSSVTGTLSAANGGTGVANNSANTITFSGNYGLTLTLSNTTSLTLPTSGTLSTVSLSAANTWSATQTFNGTSSTFATTLLNAAEPATVSATAATGTINFYINSQSVLYYTSNASANWTLNVAFSSGTSLNTAMSTGQTVTIAFLVTQGSTAYYENVFQIDGTNVTPKWQGGTAPSKGNASGIDVYTYTITKTGSAAYTVLASQTQFA